MKKNIYYFLLYIVVFGVGIGSGVYIRNKTLNPRAAFPTVLSDPMTFFVSKGVGLDEDFLYHSANITDFINKGSSKTKVSVEGTVEIVTAEPDGDAHVVVRDSTGLALVTEFIPEIKSFTIPKVGDKVRIWGITRFDISHNWWELHPVIGWEKI